MAKIHQSAGVIVIGPAGQIVVVSQNGDSWSLPKGHIDRGETALEAAKREVYEESGISKLEILEELGSYERPTIAHGGIGEDLEQIKYITLFLGRTSQVDLNPIDPLNPEAKWVDPDEVADHLTHPKDQEFFTAQLKKIYEYLRPQA